MCRSAPIIRKLADGTEEQNVASEVACPIYREEVATRRISFDFAEVTWLQYLDKKMYYFEVPSIEAQDMLLKRRSSPAASVVD